MGSPWREEPVNSNALDALRTQVSTLLDWQDAHAGYEKVVTGIPAADRGRAPAGLPYSPWQILEHLRIAQVDILDFCRNPDYQNRDWPAEYWPASPAPSRPDAWDESVRRFTEDRKALQALAVDPAIDLFAKIPHGSGQTYLRELLLIADHTSHHLGELIVIRRLQGNWNA
jgi:hypothetical protein